MRNGPGPLIRDEDDVICFMMLSDQMHAAGDVRLVPNAVHMSKIKAVWLLQ